MNEQAVYTRKELAERWKCTEQAIRNSEIEGRLKRCKGTPKILYSIEEIRRCEDTDDYRDECNPINYGRLKRENKQLLIKVKEQKETIEKVRAFLEMR